MATISDSSPTATKNQSQRAYWLQKLERDTEQRNLLFLKSALQSLRDFVGGNTQSVTKTIEDWMDAGGIKGKDWRDTTKAGHTKQVKNLFNWLVRQDVVKENPANKIEEIMVGEYEPQILTVEQSREFMEITREDDPELLTPAVLNLFRGIRPSEVRRLGEQIISI